MIDNLKTTKFNDEVVFAIDTIVKIDKKEIIGLKQMAKLNKRRRFRLCAHKDIEDSIHEMLIVHEKDCYVRPHMHVNKTESFHIIEGTVDVIIFDEDGVCSACNNTVEYKNNTNWEKREEQLIQLLDKH